MLIKSHSEVDFEMIYYNADGSKSLCGNGSRCAVDFARSLGMISNKTTFITNDGKHEANIEGGWVHFALHDLPDMFQGNGFYFIDNGSPHHVVFMDKDVDTQDVYAVGKQIREAKKYQPNGTNVNFAQIKENTLQVRTYERGVEGETLSCGTGAIASALACHYMGMKPPIHICTLGGKLSVTYKKQPVGFSNIILSGPATKVFSGHISI